MAAKPALQFEIVANVDGVKDGLAVSTKSVEQAAEAMQLAFGKTAAGAKSASKEHVGLLGVLKEFKAEQVQQARTANFLAAEITGIIPASAGASGAMKGLLGAGLELAAGGGAIAVGFELTKVALEHVVSKIDEAAERSRVFRAAQFSTIESLRAAYEGLAESFARPINKTAKAAQDESRKAQAEIRKLGEELHALATDKSVSAWFANLFGRANSTEMEKLQSKIEGIVSGFKVKAPAAAADAAAGERAQQARDASAQILSIQASAASSVQQLRAGLAAKLKELDWDAAKYGEQTGAVRVALEAQTNEQIRRSRADAARSYREAEFSLLTDVLSQKAIIEGRANLRTRALLDEYNTAKKQGDTEAMQRIKSLAIVEQDRARRDLENLQTKRDLDTNTTPELAAYRKQRDDSQREIEASLVQSAENMQSRVEGLAGGLASAWASSLRGMLSGTQSFTESVSGLFRGFVDEMISMIAQLAAKWLVFNSIAGLVGMFTGGGALSFGSFGLTKLLGFADGGQVSGGRPILVGERGPEVFLPGASGGTVVPNHALGGGGVTININGPVYDAGGVRALASDPQFIAGWREAVRNGRIS